MSSQASMSGSSKIASKVIATQICRRTRTPTALPRAHSKRWPTSNTSVISRAGHHAAGNILRSVHHAEPLAAKELWSQMNIKRFWTMLVADCCSVYYAHPHAWDEIGFGGPAYPRGYMRLEEGEPEPWEVEEQRYEWAAPDDSFPMQKRRTAATANTRRTTDRQGRIESRREYAISGRFRRG